MWQQVLERFEKHAPASVMARIALEQAMPAAWLDEVFEANRQRQYPRELLFSTVVELMTLVSLGLQPSLHAAARKMEHLPVSLAALYDKVKRTELPLLRALVQGSSARLRPIAAALDVAPCVPGWQVRIVDGNHLPGSQSAWRRCAGTVVRRCPVTRWWCTTPTWRRWSIWWPARTPTKVSAPA